MLEYLGQNISEARQVGDRFELNGQLRKIVEVVELDKDSEGRPQKLIVSQVVRDVPPLPSPVRWGLRVLAKIAGVRCHDL